jgi:aspartyl/glutamyl-tRNA(Asn/Gln) amidotransferase C subunit
MKLSETDITHLGKLARLDLAPEIRQKFAEQISRVLEYVETINKIEVSNTEGEQQRPHVGIEKLAQDVVEPGSTDELLDLVPKREGRSIISPPLQ